MFMAELHNPYFDLYSKMYRGKKEYLRTPSEDMGLLILGEGLFLLETFSPTNLSAATIREVL